MKRLPHLLLILPPALLAACSDDGGDVKRADIYTVERGDLQIRITENGELQPFQSTNIKNQMEGRTTIIYLIPEGSVVEAGQKLVELDASDVLDRKAQQGIALSRAEADKLAASKELDIQTKQAQADAMAAEDKVRIAQIDLEKFLGKEREDGSRDMGEREQQRIDAEANIQLAEAELKLAEDKLGWSEKLFDKGFITKDELERDRIDVERNQNSVKVAQNQLDILTRFTFAKTMIELTQGVRQADIELENTKARGEAHVAQAKADLDAKQKEYELALERFQNLENQVKHSVIYAPTPGLVVYAHEDGWRNDSAIEEGVEVRERQDLIVLPDVSRMVAQLKVHEAMVDKVHVGQPARIKVEARPERSWTGTVRRVSPVADSGSRWSNNDLKVYKTEVALDGVNDADDGLKPNMTAQVTIVVDQLHDVLYVPLAAVKRKGTVTYVWQRTASGPVAQKVEIGENDFQYVVVSNGLSEGDQVYLAVPNGAPEPDFPGAGPIEQQPTAQATAENQPASEAPAVHGPASDPAAGTPPADGAENGGSPGGGGSPPAGMQEAMDHFQQLLAKKHPELAEQVKGDRRALFGNEEVRSAIENDPELREARDALMQQLQRGRPGGGSGRPGGRSGRPRSSQGPAPSSGDAP